MEQSFLHTHSSTVSLTSPGFHRTAVLGVWAFTVMLFYFYVNYTQTGIPMDLLNYPLNTIPQHLYIDLNNTLYWLTKSTPLFKILNILKLKDLYELQTMHLSMTL